MTSAGMPDDMGITVSSGIPIPVLWERHGRVVRWIFATEAVEPGDEIIATVTYEVE